MSLKDQNKTVDPDLYKKALQYAFLLLKYRPRSIAEIVSRLKKREYPQSIVQSVLSFLQEKRFLDDNEFALLFVASADNKGWGPRKIVANLRKFQVSPEIIQSAMTAHGDFRLGLSDLVDKTIGRYRDPNRYQKIVRFLLGRGFVYSDILQVLNEKGVFYREQRGLKEK